MISKFALAALGAVALFASMPAEAKDLRGDAFITAMKDNTLTGKQADGTPYKLYFVPGGQATIQQGTRPPEVGSWRLDRDGDVCLSWPKEVKGEGGCFRVILNGSHVSWVNKAGNHRGGLLGIVAPLEMSQTK